MKINAGNPGQRSVMVTMETDRGTEAPAGKGDKSEKCGGNTKPLYRKYRVESDEVGDTFQVINANHTAYLLRQSPSWCYFWRFKDKYTSIIFILFTRILNSSNTLARRYEEKRELKTTLTQTTDIVTGLSFK